MCKLNNGSLEISTSTVVDRKKVPVDLKKLDLWIVYCPDNDTLYYIPIKDLVGKKSMRIRVNKSKIMNKRMTMADKYLDIEKAW